MPFRIRLWDAKDDTDGQADGIRPAADCAEAKIRQLWLERESLAAVEREIGTSAGTKCIGVRSAGIVRRRRRGVRSPK